MLIYLIIGVAIVILLAAIDVFLTNGQAFVDKISSLSVRDELITISVVTIVYAIAWPALIVYNIYRLARDVKES